MHGESNRFRAARRALWKGVRLCALGCLLTAPAGAMQDPPSVEDRLRRLEETNRLLLEQNDALRQQLDTTNRKLDEFARRADAPPPPPPLSLAEPAIPGVTTPIFAPAEAAPPPPFRPAEAPAPAHPPRFLIGGRDEELGEYFLARSADPARVPYELRADVRTQFRYTGFPRSRTTWTNSAGQVLPVRSLNVFEINRNWLQFSGFAMDPRLQYNFALLSSTASNNTTLLGWVNYHFSDAFDLRAGYWLIPGSREWYTSFRYTMGAERLMATTFFRPNISPGIWAQGEPVEGFNYVFMVANAFNRFNQTANRIGTNLTYSGSVWWDPLGDYGVGPSDQEYHERFTPRIGTSFTSAREMSQVPQDNPANPEDTILRLSDGTPVFLANSLGAGVQVEAVSVQLWAIDAAFKYRGLSFAAEYYLRWLDNFRYRATPSAVDTLFAHGGYAQAGYFLVPDSLELFARHSIVSGANGTGAEWGGGVNWYVRRTRDWRLTLEVLQISRSPADNILTGYRAGESGTLFQLQMFTDF